MPKGIQISRSKPSKWKVSVTTKRGKKISRKRLSQLSKNGTPAQKKAATYLLKG